MMDRVTSATVTIGSANGARAPRYRELEDIISMLGVEALSLADRRHRAAWALG
ncbi:MAG: hypothetical protein IPK44_03395 [Candidatus Accumulibacter sp.]|uniref:hypothetical protein n=1 Tax=Accumulibacter sp. TaxID=2053492 RepID=UPI00338ECB64|nr:hypothetical protein [Accumulibacter sp.]